MSGKNKPPHYADTRGGRFVGLPMCMVQSPAYRALSPTARALLVELTSDLTGSNNGEIKPTYRELATRLGTSSLKAIGPAIGELQGLGFIEVMRMPCWAKQRATEYRLTFVHSGAPGRPSRATNEYLQCVPHKAKKRVAETVTRNAIRVPNSVTPAASSVTETVTRNVERSDDPPTEAVKSPPAVRVTALGTPISCHNPAASKGDTRPQEAPYLAGGIFQHAEPAEPEEHRTANVLPFVGASASFCLGEDCGNPVIGGGRGKPKLYCSETCRKRAEGRRRCGRKKAVGG